MARNDIDPAERNEAVVTYTQLVDCEECTATEDVAFSLPKGADPEDVSGTITATWTCEACGHEQTSEYEGFNIHDES